MDYVASTIEPDPAPDVVEDERPALWNPNAAASWCILLTPLFGAILHAKNWQAMGQPGRARANRVWAWVTVVFVAAILASFFVSHSEALDRVFRYAGLALLIAWYYAQGKPQAKYVKEHLNNAYTKRGWGMPLLLGFGGLLVYLVIGLTLAVATFTYMPEELIEEIEPALIADWHSTPGVDTAKIESFTLKDIGNGMYVGTIEAEINGDPIEYGISVDATWDGITWVLE